MAGGLQVGDSAACCPLLYGTLCDECLQYTDMHIKFIFFL